MSFAALRAVILILTPMVVILPASGSDDTGNALNHAITSLLTDLESRSFVQHPATGELVLKVGNTIRIEGCADYPYHVNDDPEDGYIQLAEDISEGLKQGLQCLAGLGPMGKQHPYHVNQASWLMEILSGDVTKTFRCVQDETFAYAVSRASPERIKGDTFDEVTRDLPYPGVLIDTYRISGFLSRKHEASTYREFFKLDERLIDRHLNNRPLQLDGLHRYRNRPALLFHEMAHWLGHVHSSTYPDVVELYETCCFGGDDHISDADANRDFQQQACNILRDGELWEVNRYKQMRLWKYRGYDQLKRTMRAAYD